MGNFVTHVVVVRNGMSAHQQKRKKKIMSALIASAKGEENDYIKKVPKSGLTK